MKRKYSVKYTLKDPILFKKKALAWASHFSHCSYFNHNNIQSFPHGPFNEILAAGALEVLKFDGKNDFDTLKEYHTLHQDWMIGYLAYDLKNQTENLKSSNPDELDFPDISFYLPRHLLFFDKNSVRLETDVEPNEILKQINNFKIASSFRRQSTVPITNTSKEEYLETVNQLRRHILEGDIYEINYCIAFTAKEVKIDPVATYLNLTALSPTPFSVFHKFDEAYLICASPERFLKKSGRQLISQPIKGTARRGVSPDEDEIIKQQLRTDEKELAENMMIVDLVRNDLARSSKSGSVKVEEMFGIYTFRQLHQMISTVTSELHEDIHFIDAIKNAFPMGSMTGAPKIKVMELIEHYEKAKRGLYSGAMGYITPGGDFDFNVVIRSLLYSHSLKQLSFEVGSAITYDAQAEKEYEECLLKANAIIQVLGIEAS